MKLEQLNIHNQNQEFFACLILYAKVDSKWTMDLNVWTKAIKLLEENKEKNLLDYKTGKDVLDIAPEVHSIKENKS